MLIVFYGLTLDLGHVMREYMKAQGFRIIDKILYEEKDTPVQAHFSKRKPSASLEEIEACNFQYTTNYGKVGFNRSDIFDAIYGKENAVLSMTSDSVEFLQHIKVGYGDAVSVIGTYISREAHDALITRLGLPEEERIPRLATGETVATNELQNRHLFDNILIYDGENSRFNMASIEMQLAGFVQQAKERQKRFLNMYYIEAPYQGSDPYVFLSYSHANKTKAHELIAFLQFNGVRVWYDAGIPYGSNWRNVIADKIDRSAVIVLMSSATAVESEHVEAEILLAQELHRTIIKLNLDDARFPRGIEMYLRPFNQLNYDELTPQNKDFLIKTLAEFGVQKITVEQNTDGTEETV